MFDPFASPLRQHFSHARIFPDGVISAIHYAAPVRDADATRLHDELALPPERPLLAVIQESPFGWHDYAFDLIGSYEAPDDPPEAPRFWLHGSPQEAYKSPRKPPYNALDPYTHAADPDILIAWRRRVAYQPAHAWLEVRWHPLGGETTVLHQEAYTMPLEEAQEAFETLVKNGRRLLQKIGQRGRPPGGKYFHSREEFCETVVNLIRKVIRTGARGVPTQSYIAELLFAQTKDDPTAAPSVAAIERSSDSSARLIRIYQKRFGYTWKALVSLARTPS
jgi:hypothetical protein